MEPVGLGNSTILTGYAKKFPGHRFTYIPQNRDTYIKNVSANPPIEWTDATKKSWKLKICLDSVKYASWASYSVVMNKLAIRWRGTISAHRSVFERCFYLTKSTGCFLEVQGLGGGGNNNYDWDFNATKTHQTNYHHFYLYIYIYARQSSWSLELRW